MPNPVIAHYQDARGQHHDIVVRKTPDSAWEVVDISVHNTTVIETLTRRDEGRPEAEAIAREYGREREAEAETGSAASRA